MNPANLLLSIACSLLEPLIRQAARAAERRAAELRVHWTREPDGRWLALLDGYSAIGDTRRAATVAVLERRDRARGW